MASDLPPIFDGIEAVCFDAFGTLVEITDKRGAYLPLFRALPPDKRCELKHRLMREDRAVDDWPELLGVEVSPSVVKKVHRRVSAEVASVAMRSGMADIWTTLRTWRPTWVARAAGPLPRVPKPFSGRRCWARTG